MALVAKFNVGKKCFEIEIPKREEKLEIKSSGLFDTERELVAWAHENGKKALGFLDGSQKHQYVLVYEGKVHDVEVKA